MTVEVRPRYGGSKTRTGCVTCKSRRVKCDERKPNCQRCEKAGRVCEGYRAPSARRHADQLTIVSYIPTAEGRLSAHTDSSTHEQRALSFFQHKTAPELAGNFSTELWTKFMLLVAHHQTSVKHALIALSSVHEAFANAEDLIPQPASELALQHYGKAISGILAVRDSKSRDAVEIALVSCIIFSCLESMRGFYLSAMTHVRSGMSILDEEQIGSPGADHAYIPRKMLRSLFIRLDSQMVNIGGTGNVAGMSLVREVQVSIPRCYSSIDEALNEFEILYNHAVHIAHQVDQIGVDPTSLPTTYQQLRQDMAKIEETRVRWEEAYNAMLLSNLSGFQPRDPPCLVLTIYNNILRVMNQVDLIDPDRDFDRFTHIFQHAIDDAEEYIYKTSVLTPANGLARSLSSSLSIQSTTADYTPSACSGASPLPTENFGTPQSTSTGSRSLTPYSTSSGPRSLTPRPPPRITPNFSLTTGVVAALYLVSARCRSGPLRHRALSLLKTCNRREGFWDSRIAASIAEGIITIEETTFQAAAIPDTEVDQQIGMAEGALQDYSLIPDNMRVRTVDVTFGPDDSGKVDFSFLTTVDAYSLRDKGVQPFDELLKW